MRISNIKKFRSGGWVTLIGFFAVFLSAQLGIYGVRHTWHNVVSALGLIILAFGLCIISNALRPAT